MKKASEPSSYSESDSYDIWWLRVSPTALTQFDDPKQQMDIPCLEYRR
jgi:hypothetical protein